MIDLRSDTVTRPTAEMIKAMALAEVGDDVLGDDPTVIRLQERAAELTGKEAALFVPSGCMANLVSLLTLTGRNEEVICGGEAHVYTSEVGGTAILGNVFLRPLSNLPNGQIDLELLAGAVRREIYTPVTRVVSLENTHNRCSGAVLPLDYLRKVAALCEERGVYLHLDGARLFNASVASGISVRDYASTAKVVNFCLSKGLGAPVGSVVCGEAGFIAECKRTRRMLGGGMRQAGILAAAGLYALDHHVERLAEDHWNAKRLAEGLAKLPGIQIDPSQIETNIVIFGAPDPGRFVQIMSENGVLLSRSGANVRAVTHLGVDEAQIDKAIQLAASVL
ncbi:MAG: low-specificity L-threonine aldolase [Armatimonadetes bacterium]|nr:low-specificity L-threonine aldolase [Armatimonadota bacterium]